MSSQSIPSSSTEDLKQRYNQLRADRACLSSQLASLRAVPDTATSATAPLDAENDELGRTLRSLEEKSILYRSAAWTCFEIDLDVGRRARSLRDPSSANKDGDLGLGIRLDTFWRGRFYEPYYLVFARPSQMLDSMPSLESTTVGDVDASSLSDGLRLIRHTVPHFVPLGQLVEKYLPSVIGGDNSGGEGIRRDNEAGGLTMLSQLQELPGVHAFLSDLHCHLQAYVSRRQQAMALQELKLPGSKGDKDEPSLEALGTEAFDLVKVTWRIPSTESPRDDAGNPNDDMESNPTAAALKAVAKRKRDQPEDEPITHLELIVQYDDLQSDRLVDQTRPSSLFSSSTASGHESAEAPSAVEGTRKPYGTVRVQFSEYAPELEVRQRRTPGISKADIKALRAEATRRLDLEQLYAQEQDGEALDMDEAFARVANFVWSQGAKGVASNIAGVVQTVGGGFEWERERRAVQRLLRAKVDPRLYTYKQPNFRELARKFPVTFAPHVSDDGGYEAKLNFQDAVSVRALAETLLVHDFGLDVRLSEENLCPMVPNRVAYVALMHELMRWSLPTERLLRWWKGQRGKERKGRDVITALDVGTGASAIYAVLTAACFPSWEVVGTDIDPASLAWAKEQVVNRNSHVLGNRVSLRLVKSDDPFIPADLEDQVAFTMCNPPFFSSSEDKAKGVEFKTRPPNAICHGTDSEMITAGGEVEFVRRMIRESLIAPSSDRVGWWTCMLGKLSSVFTMASELKALAREGHVGGWGTSELKTGGGKTKRWVLIWTISAMRLSDALTRREDDESGPSEKVRTVSTERTTKVLQLGPGKTRKEVLQVVRRTLHALDGCHSFTSAYQALAELRTLPRHLDNKEMTAGTLDVVLTHESWTRRARRAKLRQDHSPQPETVPDTEATPDPLLMVRISVDEVTASIPAGGGLQLKVCWTFGWDAVKFESFAMFLIAAVERALSSASPTL